MPDYKNVFVSYVHLYFMKYFRENRLLFYSLRSNYFFYIVLQRDDYELHRDEYLYLEMGKHLSWGYFEVPPLIALQGMALSN